MPIALRQRVSDFVEQCIAYLFGGVEQHERAGQRDQLPLHATRSESPASVIEGKVPTDQAMLAHQLKGEQFRVGGMQRTSEQQPFLNNTLAI